MANRAAKAAPPLTRRKRIVFIAASVLLVLVLLELLVRGMVAVKRAVFDPRLPDCAEDPNFKLCPLAPFWVEFHNTVYIDPLIGTRYEPGHHGEWITINSHGFRGPEFETIKPPGVTRIVVVGSSSLFGGGQHDDGTITHFLQEDLDGQFGEGKYEVINAGVVAANSAQEVAIIQNLVVDWDPDVVIVYSGRNDVAYALLPDWQPHYNGQLVDLMWTDRHPLAIPRVGESFREFTVALLSQSELYRVSSQVVGSALSGEGDAGEELDERVTDPAAVEVYKDSLRYMAFALQTHDIPMVYIFQPTLGGSDRPLTAPEQELVEYYTKMGVLGPILEFYPQFIEAMFEVAEEYDFPAYDFGPVLDGQTGKMFQSSVHLYPEGNQLIAGEMMDVLIELEWVGP